MQKKTHRLYPIGVSLLTAVVAVGIMFAGCGKKKSEDKKSPAANQAKPQPRPAARTAALPKVPVDKAFAAAVKKATMTCPPGRFRGCPAFKEVAKLRDQKGRELDMFISTMALIAGPDPKVATMAANSFSWHNATTKALYLLYKQNDKMPKALFEAALKNMNNLQTTGHAKVFGALAGMYGMADQFLAQALANKDKKRGAMVAWFGAQKLMKIGGGKTFAAIQKLAKRPGSAGPRRPWVLAAIKSPLSMYKWAPADYTSLCPWAAKFLQDKNFEVVELVGAIMVRCGKQDPKYIDTLLAAGKKRIQEHPETWKSPVDFPYRDPCFGGFFGGVRKGVAKAMGKDGKPAVPPVCVKVYDFLVWVAKQPKVADDMKVHAVDWITYQERTVRAIKWLKKLRRAKSKAVVAEVKKEMKKLKKKK